MKTGSRHLAALNDGRHWILDGVAVDNVTTHAAFRNFTATAAGFFDAVGASENRERMSFASPTSGARVGRHWQLPTTRDELLGICAHMEAMAALTCGMVGRSPDHVAAALAGMVMGIEVFERVDPRGAGALLDYFRHARDIAAASAQWHDTRAHVYQNYQSLVRLTVKLRFMLGIARRIAEINGIIGMPQVRDTLGALASKAVLLDAALAGMEAAGEHYRGYYVPNRGMLCAGQAAAQRLYPEIVHTLRELAGGGLIMLPSSIADLQQPHSRALVQRTQHSPAASSLERVKFFKLAWDAIGSEFGSRHLQYEMFYSGAPFVIHGHNFRFYDWAGASDMVQGFMDSYETPGVVRS